jgi:hypothetical protein
MLELNATSANVKLPGTTPKHRLASPSPNKLRLIYKPGFATSNRAIGHFPGVNPELSSEVSDTWFDLTPSG